MYPEKPPSSIRLPGGRAQAPGFWRLLKGQALWNRWSASVSSQGPAWALWGSGQGSEYQGRLRKHLALRHRKDLKRVLNMEQVQMGGGGSYRKGWGKTVRLAR